MRYAQSPCHYALYLCKYMYSQMLYTKPRPSTYIHTAFTSSLYTYNDSVNSTRYGYEAGAVFFVAQHSLSLLPSCESLTSGQG